MIAKGRPNSDAAVYTNFLILDRFQLSDGRSLIDYQDPAHSPLVQMGLPRENATTPHPKVPGASARSDLWKPVFESTDDKRFTDAMEWIKSMYRPRPQYPIPYEPPGASAPGADAAALPQPR